MVQLEELEDRDVAETSVVLNKDGSVTAGATNGPIPLNVRGKWSFDGTAFRLVRKKGFGGWGFFFCFLPNTAVMSSSSIYLSRRGSRQSRLARGMMQLNLLRWLGTFKVGDVFFVTDRCLVVLYVRQLELQLLLVSVGCAFYQTIIYTFTFLKIDRVVVLPCPDLT